MYSFIISLIFLVCVMGGTYAGFRLRSIIPEHHVDSESKDTVKLATGLLATLSALVLGLLVASAKSSFDSVGSGITQQAARVIYLDRELANYGPDAAALRIQLHQVVVSVLATIWPKPGAAKDALEGIGSAHVVDRLENAVRKLVPVTNEQREIRDVALRVCEELSSDRWLIFLQAQSPIPIAFLVGLLFWLTTLHCGFGLLAARNMTVIAALCVSAIAVSGTVFLILELDHPLSGSIRVSSAPFEEALKLVGK